MRAIRKISSALLSKSVKGHFGQWAEDVLVRKLFPKTKTSGVYLDIGAYHPFTHSNTAYFWLKGWHGFNVDANRKSIEVFNRVRPHDTNIWAAIVPEEQYANGLHRASLMLPDSPDSKEGVSAMGTANPAVGGTRRFRTTTEVPALSVSALIKSQKITEIDYLNVDIEGYDEFFVRDFDFRAMGPKVITIEDNSADYYELLDSPITTHLKAHAYSLVGRAGPTSIFLRDCG